MNLSAVTRTIFGKKVKALRRAHQIPAIVYGHGVTPRAITVPEGALASAYRAAGASSILDIAIDGATSTANSCGKSCGKHSTSHWPNERANTAPNSLTAFASPFTTSGTGALIFSVSFTS